MTSQPLVSILVPIYNVENYLDQCLASISNQTYQNFEAICINDGSTDKSRDIIQKYLDEDPRFRVIDKENSGYGDSMNRGLDTCTGDYISILESDDYIDKVALEKMVKKALDNDLDVLKCNFWLYWSKATQGTNYRNNLYFPVCTPEMVNLGVHQAIDRPEIFWSKNSIWSALYKRSFLEENNVRFLPTPGASFQDTSFNFKVMACAKRLAYSGEAYLHYRQDNENSSVNSAKKMFCVCDEHAEIRRFLEDSSLNNSQALQQIRTLCLFYNYRWNYDRLANDLKKEFLDKFAAELREELDAGYIPSEHYGANKKTDFPEWRAFRYFSDGEIDEVKQIAFDTDFYYAKRLCEAPHGGKLGTLKTYYKIGGYPFVIRLIKEMMTRH